MGARYKVKVPAVQVTVGARAHFVELDGILPDGVDEATIDRFLEEELVEEIVAESNAITEDPDAAAKAAAEAEAAAKAEAEAKAKTEAAKKPATPAKS